MTIDVECVWRLDENGLEECVGFQSDHFFWPIDKVESYDWKEDEGPQNLKGVIVGLCTGDDSVNYASMDDAQPYGSCVQYVTPLED